MFNLWRADIHQPRSHVPNPSDGIGHKPDLPGGTKYQWKDPQKVQDDVNTPGDHDEVIVVIYPDGQTSEITVTIHVTPADRGNGDNNGNGNITITGNNNGTTTNAQKQALPQTGNENSSAIGLGIAGLKRRKND
ncbi:Rib/alpha-like domain-containing protein [Limosilactobacillus caecicola]|uniref:Rib/alpha-like domain-containing protein n=1 Tax=Limosilactobacillus caecicola TaxID=2941332 RepID=UPI00203F18F1|nr:Rib/alpha-like domain-containing protein [Limosilactobacillus caecicola]